MGYNKENSGYQHQVDGTESYCHEGIDGIYDHKGTPVTEALI